MTTISNNAFEYCSALTSVEIPDNVTTIGKEAFLWCQSLKNIAIPKSIKLIGENAFTGTNSLREVYYGGTKAQWEAITGYGKSDLTAVTIHCTDGDINKS